MKIGQHPYSISSFSLAQANPCSAERNVRQSSDTHKVQDNRACSSGTCTIFYSLWQCNFKTLLNCRHIYKFLCGVNATASENYRKKKQMTLNILAIFHWHISPAHRVARLQLCPRNGNALISENGIAIASKKLPVQPQV